ncbi:hypothetical protein K474DRAFT_1680955, partial [Panus rudis PR-1116 ss-1]
MYNNFDRDSSATSAFERYTEAANAAQGRPKKRPYDKRPNKKALGETAYAEGNGCWVPGAMVEEGLVRDAMRGPLDLYLSSGERSCASGPKREDSRRTGVRKIAPTMHGQGREGLRKSPAGEMGSVLVLEAVRGWFKLLLDEKEVDGDGEAKSDQSTHKRAQPRPSKGRWVARTVQEPCRPGLNFEFVKKIGGGWGEVTVGGLRQCLHGKIAVTEILTYNNKYPSRTSGVREQSETRVVQVLEDGRGYRLRAEGKEERAVSIYDMTALQTEQTQAPGSDVNPVITPGTGENAAQGGSNKGSPKTQSDTPAQANEASNDTTQTQD